MAKKLSKRALKWIIAAVAVVAVGVHRLPLLEEQAERAARGHRRPATAASRRSSSTWRPRSRCGSRRSSSTKARSSSPVRCWCGWTPSRWRRSWPRPRPTSPRRRSSWRSPRRRSSSRRARSTLAEIEVKRSGRRSSTRAPARSASSTSAARSWRRRRPRSREAEASCRPRSRRSRSRRPTRRRSRRASTTRRSSRRSPAGSSIAWPSPARSSRPGGKALTLVNLEDVYMEIFLPSEQAARVKIGAEGADHRRLRSRTARSPDYVSFVSPEAQFTPKQVETRSEREKLMFRVKIQVPKELASQYVERIKTGVRGVGYVKLRTRRRLAGRAAEPRSRPTVAESSRPSLSMPTSAVAEPAAQPATPVVSIRGRHPPLRQGRRARRHLARHSRAASWSASSAPTASASRRCWR